MAIKIFKLRKPLGARKHLNKFIFLTLRFTDFFQSIVYMTATKNLRKGNGFLYNT